MSVFWLNSSKLLFEKLKEKHVPGPAGTEGEIRNRWIRVHVGGSTRHEMVQAMMMRI